MKQILHTLLACACLLLCTAPVLAQKGLDKAMGEFFTIVIFWAAIVIGLVILVVVFVLFVSLLLTLAGVLRGVAPHNRLMEPYMLWLNVVPGLNLVWMFVTVIRVPDSLKKEFRERGCDYRVLSSKLFGVISCSSHCLFIVLGCTMIAGHPSAWRWLESFGDSVILGFFSGVISLLVFTLVTGLLFWSSIAVHAYRLHVLRKEDGAARPRAQSEPSSGFKDLDGR